MATYAKKLLDAYNNTILPYTRASLVYMTDDTQTLETFLSDIPSKAFTVNIKSRVYGDISSVTDGGLYSIHPNIRFIQIKMAQV